jgi:hypothetical protein
VVLVSPEGIAPVNAFASWPRSSLSAKLAGSAAQLTLMNGHSERQNNDRHDTTESQPVQPGPEPDAPGTHRRCQRSTSSREIARPSILPTMTWCRVAGAPSRGCPGMMTGTVAEVVRRCNGFPVE